MPSAITRLTMPARFPWSARACGLRIVDAVTSRSALVAPGSGSTTGSRRRLDDEPARVVVGDRGGPGLAAQEHPSVDLAEEAVDPHRRDAHAVARVAADAAGRRPHDRTDVDLGDHLLRDRDDVDPVHDRVHVDPRHDLSTSTWDDLVDVDPVDDALDVDPVDDPLHVDPLEQRVHVRRPR